MNARDIDRLLGMADQHLAEWRECEEDGGEGPNAPDLIEREREWAVMRPRIVACVNACQGIADPAALVAAARAVLAHGDARAQTHVTIPATVWRALANAFTVQP